MSGLQNRNCTAGPLQLGLLSKPVVSFE